MPDLIPQTADAMRDATDAARFERRLAEGPQVPLTHRFHMTQALRQLGRELLTLADDIIDPSAQLGAARRLRAMGLHLEAQRQLAAHLREFPKGTHEGQAAFNACPVDDRSWVASWALTYRPPAEPACTEEG